MFNYLIGRILAFIWEKCLTRLDKDGNEITENAISFELFQKFIKLPAAERSLRMLAREAGISEKSIYNYSSDWNWSDRARAYDEHIAQLFNQVYDDQVKKAAIKHAKRAEEFMEFGDILLKEVFSRSTNKNKEGMRVPDPEFFDRLSPLDLINMLDKSQKNLKSLTEVYRLSHGLETSKSVNKNEVSGSLQLTEEKVEREITEEEIIQEMRDIIGSPEADNERESQKPKPKRKRKTSPVNKRLQARKKQEQKKKESN